MEDVWTFMGIALATATLIVAVIALVIHVTVKLSKSDLDGRFALFTERQERHNEDVKAAIAKGTEEHKAWQKEMKKMRKRVDKLWLRAKMDDLEKRLGDQS